MTPTGRPCQLVVCRGCCCGTAKKRPGVDHDDQLARLRQLRDGEGREVPVRTSTCLGPCFQANVVVVQPSAAGRHAGGRPVWLGDFTEERLIGDLDGWLRAGGPGAAPLPGPLADLVTSKDAKKPKKGKKGKKLKKSDRKKKGAGGEPAESVEPDRQKQEQQQEQRDGERAWEGSGEFGEQVHNGAKHHKKEKKNKKDKKRKKDKKGRE